MPGARPNSSLLCKYYKRDITIRSKIRYDDLNSLQKSNTYQQQTTRWVMKLSRWLKCWNWNVENLNNSKCECAYGSVIFAEGAIWTSIAFPLYIALWIGWLSSFSRIVPGRVGIHEWKSETKEYIWKLTNFTSLINKSPTTPHQSGKTGCIDHMKCSRCVQGTSAEPLRSPRAALCRSQHWCPRHASPLRFERECNKSPSFPRKRLSFSLILPSYSTTPHL